MLGAKEYKKLKLSILKELYDGNRNFTSIDYDIDYSNFHEVIGNLSDENYIKGVVPIRVTSGSQKTYLLDNIQITEKGIKFVEENSSLYKAYNGLKEIRNWLP